MSDLLPYLLLTSAMALLSPCSVPIETREAQSAAAAAPIDEWARIIQIAEPRPEVAMLFVGPLDASNLRLRR